MIAGRETRTEEGSPQRALEFSVLATATAGDHRGDKQNGMDQSPSHDVSLCRGFSSCQATTTAAVDTYMSSLAALGLSPEETAAAIAAAERERRWEETERRSLSLSADSLVRDRTKEEYVELAFFLPHKPSTVECWQVELEIPDEAARVAPPPIITRSPGSSALPEKCSGGSPSSSSTSERVHALVVSAEEGLRDENREMSPSAVRRSRSDGSPGNECSGGGTKDSCRDGEGLQGSSSVASFPVDIDPLSSSGKPSTSKRDLEKQEGERDGDSRSGVSPSADGSEASGLRVLSEKDWEDRGAGEANLSVRLSVADGLRKVWRVLSRRKAKIHALLRRYRRVSKGLYKAWRR